MGSTLALVITLIALGVVARIPYLLEPVGYDEAITYVYFASRSLLDIVSDYTIPNNHILHSILIKVAESVFGPGTVAIRLPAFLAAIAAIPLTFCLATIVAGTRVGIVAAGMVATAPALVEYSTQARGYTMVAAFVLVGWILAELLRREPNVAGYALFATAFALAAFTIPTAVMGFGVSYGVILLTHRLQRRRTLGYLIAATVGMAVLSVFLWAPAALVSGWRSIIANPYVESGSLSLTLRWLPNLASRTLDCWGGGFPLGGKVAFTSVGLVGLLWTVTHRQALARITVVALVVVPLFIIGQRTTPPPRTVDFLFTLFAIVAATGVIAVVEWLPRATVRFRDWAAIIVAVVIAVTWGWNRWTREPVWQSPDEILASGRMPGLNGVNYCAEGFFLDAEPIADQIGALVTPRSTITAPPHSGINVPVQYYLLRRGYNPAIQHRYVTRLAIGQFVGYDTVYVVVYRRAPSVPVSHQDVLNAFAIGDDAIARAGFTLQPFRRYRRADVYTLTLSSPVIPRIPPRDRQPMRHPR